jgi:hypothetical protein
MANTYNAQLAKNVGQAQGTPFVDIAGSFSKAFDARVDEAVKTNREADDKRSEWEGEAINFDVDVNGDSPEVAAAKMEEAEKFRKQWLADIQVGDPFDPNKRRKLEEYKSRISQLNQSSQYLEALKKDNVANVENISPANDPEAYQRMQELLKSKPIWDEKTKKYGYAVGDTIKTRAQLEKDILDVIEVPTVGMSNIYSAFAKGSGIEKKVDPNDPRKYGYSWIHAKPVLEAEIMAQANDKAYGKDFIYHSLSQGDGMYVKNPKYANLTKSEMDAKAEFELRASGRLSINDKDPVVINGKINSYLKEQVVDSYLNGFKEENKDSIIEVTPPVKEATEGAIKRALDREDKKAFGDALIQNAKKLSAGGDKGELSRFMTKDGNLRPDQIEAYGRAVNLPNTVVVKAPPVFKTEKDEDDNEIQVQINPNEYIVANDRTGKQVPFNANNAISPEDLEGFALTAYGFNAKEIEDYKSRKKGPQLP